MKLHPIPTLTALLVSGALSLAQAQTPGAGSTGAPLNATTSPSTTPVTPPSPLNATPPSTTPMSPPVTTPNKSAGSSMSNRDAAATLEEAKKACRNQPTQQAQQDCMKRAQDDFERATHSRLSPVTPPPAPLLPAPTPVPAPKQ